MKRLFPTVLCLLMICSAAIPEASSLAKTPVDGPQEIVYAQRDSMALHLYIFKPEKLPAAPIPAIAIFHGGGWHIGKAQWAFGLARKFAGMGMLAVSVQYRLSDEKSITPLEAMADARTALRWMRSHADSLKINPKKIAAYGWSAGAHLIASAAIFNDADSGATVDCSPDAMILSSPALSLLSERWFRHLLLGRADFRDLSPDEHIRSGLPPTIILQGETDTVTPLAGSERFWRRMRAAGNRCEMEIYKGVGHLFTPMGIPDTGSPQSDTKVEAAAAARVQAFLRSLNYCD